MRGGLLSLFASVLLAACDVEPPAVGRVVPGTVEQGQAVVVRVEGRDLVPAWNAWGDAVIDVRVDVDGAPAELVAYAADGTSVEVRLPAGLAAGSADVRVRTAGGEDTLEGGLVIRAAP